MKPTLSVIAPAYNEEESVRPFYAELKPVLQNLSDRYDSKILFILDGCTDGTLKELNEIAAVDKSVRVVVLSARFGHQMALLAGIDHCNEDIVVMMDCDLQHPPAVIPELIDNFEKGYDIVHTIRKDAADTGFFKKLSSKLFYWLLNRISLVPISENAADFRLISRKVAVVFKNQIRERNQFLRGLFRWVGFSSTSIPFQARKRSLGKSKYSLGRMVSFGLQGIVSFSKKPLKAAITIGVIFAFSGFVFIPITIVRYFHYGTFPSGWATLAILISLFSGVQLIFLGIIGEYIGAIFDEVKGRPHYLIDKMINFDEP
jgi:polyisoprenyl-phosphate glycosyltransferase